MLKRKLGANSEIYLIEYIWLQFPLYCHVHMVFVINGRARCNGPESFIGRL